MLPLGIWELCHQLEAVLKKGLKLRGSFRGQAVDAFARYQLTTEGADGVNLLA